MKPIFLGTTLLAALALAGCADHRDDRCPGEIHTNAVQGILRDDGDTNVETTDGRIYSYKYDGKLLAGEPVLVCQTKSSDGSDHYSVGYSNRGFWTSASLVSDIHDGVTVARAIFDTALAALAAEHPADAIEQPHQFSDRDRCRTALRDGAFAMITSACEAYAVDLGTDTINNVTTGKAESSRDAIDSDMCDQSKMIVAVAAAYLKQHDYGDAGYNAENRVTTARWEDKHYSEIGSGGDAHIKLCEDQAALAANGVLGLIPQHHTYDGIQTYYPHVGDTFRAQ